MTAIGDISLIYRCLTLKLTLKIIIFLEYLLETADKPALTH